eukprot:XP_002944114.2 PREDICTED: shugoshin 2 [Xenopus tropicalis]
MAAQPGAALLTLQSVKERMREKLQGPLRAVRLNTTLAAKIKTKTLNNSSILKISLKHNNKVLACALTAEREKSRRLESDRMFLQKEVTMLNFQNALLRQNLSLLNKMLKDIDLFMNVNLPAAIEISEIEHSADLSTSEPRRSERFSRHSALSLGEEQGFRITGTALRVPSSSIGGRRTIAAEPVPGTSMDNSVLSTSLRERSGNQSNRHSAPATGIPGAPEGAANHSPNGQDPRQELRVSEVLNSDVCGFVTKRKKPSSASRSSAHSSKSDFNPNPRLESGNWAECEPNPEGNGTTGPSGWTPAGAEWNSPQRVRRTTAAAESLPDPQINSDQSEGTAADLLLEPNGQSVGSLSVGRVPSAAGQNGGQEKTVYDADMEMTSSDGSAPIITVSSLSKTHGERAKSCIPVKRDGAALRKVKVAKREKTHASKKHGATSIDKQIKGKVKEKRFDLEDKDEEQIGGHTQPHADAKPALVAPPAARDALGDPETPAWAQPIKQEETEITCDSGIGGKRHQWGENEGTTHLAPEPSCEQQVLPGERTEPPRPEEPLEEIKSETAKRSHMISSETATAEISKKRQTRIVKRKPKQQGQGLETGSAETSANASGSLSLGKTGGVFSSFHSNTEGGQSLLRRETYFVSTCEATTSATGCGVPRDGVRYRRETYVIHKPDLFPSNASNDLIVPETQGLSAEPESKGHKRALGSASGKVTPGGGAFCYSSSPADKRKTHVLPTKEPIGPLVRESLLDPPLTQLSKKPRVLRSLLASDSFLLDMVSESILDSTVGNSFLEFPSADATADSSFSIERPPSNNPDLELPAPEERSNFRVYGESCRAQGVAERGDGETRDQNQSADEQEVGTWHLGVPPFCLFVLYNRIDSYQQGVIKIMDKYTV